MRLTCVNLFLLATGLCLVGCEKKHDYGPTVDKFVGRLVQDGKPVAFPAGEKVVLRTVNDRGDRFGIPIQPDGTFTIGWMPIAKYSAMLERVNEQARGGPNMYNVPGGFTIEEGKTEYSIELGKGWKP